MHVSQHAPQPKPASFADPDALMERISEMILHGRLGVARPLLAAVERLTEPSARRDELSAWLLMRENRVDEAAETLGLALARAPDDAPLRRRRAELRIMNGDLAGAAEDAAEAVTLAPGDANGKALLGTAMLGLGFAEDAAACLREAVSGAPRVPLYHQVLAAAREALGDLAGATETLERGLAANPCSVSLWTASVLHRVRQRDFTGALEVCERARADGVADACLCGLKGHSLSSLGRHEEAADAYADALKLGPDDFYVRHLAAASGAVPAGDRAPYEYLRAVFDGYAPQFDDHLLTLGYRVPGLIRAAILRHAEAGEGCGPLLDLGCGTGLLAVVLCDLPLRALVGVDLSPAMLREAQGKSLYAELHEADLLTFLAGEQRRFPLAAAADVLCYFGALEAVFAAVHERLGEGGLFLFSYEESPAGESEAEAPAWSLGPQARYAHLPGYVAGAAREAGFEILEDVRQMLRYENGQPVCGRIVVLRRPA